MAQVADADLIQEDDVFPNLVSHVSLTITLYPIRHS